MSVGIPECLLVWETLQNKFYIAIIELNHLVLNKLNLKWNVHLFSNRKLWKAKNKAN